MVGLKSLMTMQAIAAIPSSSYWWCHWSAFSSSCLQLTRKPNAEESLQSCPLCLHHIVLHWLDTGQCRDDPPCRGQWRSLYTIIHQSTMWSRTNSFYTACMSGTDQTTYTRLDNIEMTPPVDFSGGVHDTIDISEHCVVVHIVPSKEASAP